MTKYIKLLGVLLCVCANTALRLHRRENPREAFVTVFLKQTDIKAIENVHVNNTPNFAARTGLTVVSSLEDFAVERLCRHLQRVNSSRPLIVITSSDSAKEMSHLPSKYNVILKILLPSEYIDILGCFMLPAYKISYQRFHVYRMIEYEKLVWLDLDISLKRNVDYLFEAPYTPNDNTLYGQLWGGGLCHDCETLDEACHQDFAGAVFMLKPSLALFDKIMDSAKRIGCKHFRSDVVVNFMLDHKSEYNVAKRHLSQKVICQERCDASYDCDIVHHYHTGAWWKGNEGQV